MSQFLGGHPDIFMARKEMHFFGSDLRFGSRFYRRDLETYLSEFNGRNSHRLAAESSVWYLFSTQAASEIKEFNPEARIIIMLREPVEMLFSLYHVFRYDGNEQLPTFELALAAEQERRTGGKITRQTYFPQGLLYRDVVRYSEQVERYFREFGRDRVHVILYNDFAADPAGVYRQTLEFLGLQPTANEQSFKVINESKRSCSPLLRRVLADRSLRGVAIKVARRLPRPIFRFLQAAEERLWRLNGQVVKRTPMSPDLRSRLTYEFAPEIESLAQLLQCDLSRWKGAALEHFQTESYQASTSPGQLGQISRTNPALASATMGPKKLSTLSHVPM
jgi:hypothetical protein